jgi:hypothetical protein
MSSVIEEFNPELEFGRPEHPAQYVKIARKSTRKSLASKEALIQTIKVFAPGVTGLFLIWFGLTTTGSYYVSATRFGDILFEIFYVWQAGTLMAMVGAIFIYDAVKRTGYL